MAFQLAPHRTLHITEEALELVFSYIDDPQDRCSISLVCRKWHAVDNCTRREITISFTAAVSPSHLTRRFKWLQSLKLKGRPRADMFGLIPENWGGYAEPWIREVSVHCPCLVSVHLRRMVVTDADLLTLAERRHMLQVLKLDKCSGFSTRGLETIVRSCRSLRVLCLDESHVEEYDGNWLHELALQNSSLEALSFSATWLERIEVSDLVTLATNCTSLSSLRVNESVDLSQLTGVLKTAASLKELGGISLKANVDGRNGNLNEASCLPKALTSLVGLMCYEEDNGDNCVLPLVQPLAPYLKKLDLQLAALSIDGHCQLLNHCVNLEVLEVLSDIGDEGLEVVSSNCKKLKRIRVESGEEEYPQGYVTQKGLISIAKGCEMIEYIAMYMSDINNAALVAVGESCPNLTDFRIVLRIDAGYTPEFPLDHGVYALMHGCPYLSRLALYLRPGSLTDAGLGCLGKLGTNLKWALLGLLGESDAGFSLLADGCPKLEKLEMRDCIFTEAGISRSVSKLKSLKYIWVQGYKATRNGQDLLTMRKMPFWNIEFVPEQKSGGCTELMEFGASKKPAQFLAYHSLAGPRTDYPKKTIVCLA